MRKLLALIGAVLLMAFMPMAYADESFIDGQVTAAGSTCTTGVCVTLELPEGASAASIQIEGTFAATLQFEAAPDKGSYVNILSYPLPSGSGASSATAGGTWQASVAGMRYIRVRCSAYTSGTALVRINGTTGALFHQ